MTTIAKQPWSQRVNLRLIAMAAIVLGLVGFPVYYYIRESVTGGIINRGDYVEVNLKAMSNFPFDQTNGKFEEIPEQFRQLDGKRVLLEGEMYAPNSWAPQIGTFELVYSIQKCCLSGPPQIQHFVQSRVLNDGKVPFLPGLVRVLGTLHVDVQKDAGRVVSVYRLDVERVEPV